MTELQRYRDFQPTAFDCKGLCAERLGIGDFWVAPVSRTRDSGPLAESNFETVLQDLGGDCERELTCKACNGTGKELGPRRPVCQQCQRHCWEDPYPCYDNRPKVHPDCEACDGEGGFFVVQVHRFGHWGPGWFEIILVAPDTPEANKAHAWADALADYPVADDEDYSEREWSAANEIWSNCYNVRDRVEMIREHNRRAADCPVSVFAARHDHIPQGDTGMILDRCRPEE